ncbi:MAG: ribonuclease E/G, partial [Burkholderiales bacterium]|nr:ribonuclease E/G [Burkholderiales bacterium]
QREVEQRLKDALHYDRARVQMGKISRFGLMELSRQRLQTSLGETSHMSCPRCNGIGHIRSVESSSLHILRILQEEAMKENTAAVHAQVPVDVATFLLNEKRSEFHAIEQRLKVNVILIPNMHLETPSYAVTRLRHDELNQMEPLPASYRMVEQPTDAREVQETPEPKAVRPQAMVQGITPEQPAPMPVAASHPAQPSILQKIFGWLTRKPEEPVEPVKAKPREIRKPQREAPQRRDRRPGREREEGAAQGAGRGAQGEGRRHHQPSGQQQRRAERAPSGERTERGQRPERGERAAQGVLEQSSRNEAVLQQGERSAAAGEERRERPPRQERGERGERPERPRGEQSAQGDGEGRSRRRRGRRDRGSRTEDAGVEATAADAMHAAAAATIHEAIEASVPSPTPAVADVPITAQATHEVEAIVAPVVETEAVVQAEPAQPKPVQLELVQPEEAPQPQASPVAVAFDSPPVGVRAEPVSYELPPELVQVETSHAAAPESEARTVEAQRPARARRPRSEPVVQEPLVQVETRNESSPPS